MPNDESNGGSCPRPADGASGRVLLSHGEGGRLSRRLLNDRVLPAVGAGSLATAGDAAILPALVGQPAFTTDAFLVTPLFFPGGDIGSLAVHGTANDLAVSGARPRWLSLSLILEEGLPLDVLDRVLASAAQAAAELDLRIVTGDTKVAPRGNVDAMFLVTSGIGERLPNAPQGPSTIVPGDVLVVSGPIGCHGLAVLAAREELGFSPAPVSDAGHLWPAVEALLTAGIVPRALRDATRGGVAAVLHEWAEAAGHSLAIEQDRVPVTDAVRGASELLGIDPLFVACEGTLVAAVAADDVDRALAALRSVKISSGATLIGSVLARAAAPVVVRGFRGQLRSLDEPAGALLPRIC